MRRLTLLLLCLCFLTACKGEESALSRANVFRAELLSKGGCSFTAKIQADYEQEIYDFTLACHGNSQGDMTLEVLAPETIAGITATVDAVSGKLSYEGLALGFPLMAQGQISPVSAPAQLLRCWLEAFVLSAGDQGELYRASFEKKLSNNVLLADTYFENGIPISADLWYNNTKILHMDILDFSYTGTDPSQEGISPE